MDYDLVVLGGGAGGLSAARAAARRGARVLIVQQGRLGGECTFSGCVPSKALIEAAGRGLAFEEAMAGAHLAIESIAAGETAEVLAGEGVEVLQGWGWFVSRSALEVDGRKISARRFVVATGAGPAVPPIEGIGDIEYLTNETLFDLDRLPASLAVMGGGAIGVEMAQAFSRLGSAVTVVEGMDRLLPREEPEASSVLARVFAEEGIAVHVGKRIDRIEPIASGAGAGAAAGSPRPSGGRLRLSGGTTIEVDAVLVAVGRRPNTEGIGLESAGVATSDTGFVVTDERLATTAKGIWAVGDVTGKMAFTHAADEMGRIAAANALSRFPRRRFRTEAIPWVTFTSPEVARVGITEAEGVTRKARVAWLPMAELDRAIVSSETAGFVKLVVGPRPLLRNLGGGRVLGATVMAARGGEMIAEVVLAMRTAMFPARLALTTCAYPTWSLAVQQAASQLFIEVQGRRAQAAGTTLHELAPAISSSPMGTPRHSRA